MFINAFVIFLFMNPLKNMNKNEVAYSFFYIPYLSMYFCVVNIKYILKGLRYMEKEMNKESVFVSHIFQSIQRVFIFTLINIIRYSIFILFFPQFYLLFIFL